MLNLQRFDQKEMKQNENVYEPGTPVKIGCLGYDHYAIVSDRIADDQPMLISLSYRTGTVAEEPWDEVVRERKVTPSRLRPVLTPEEVVQRARAAIGQRRYNLITSNCEHFVHESLGLRARSRQIEGAASAGLSTLLLVLRFARVHPAVTVAATAVSLVAGSRWSGR